MMLSSLFVLSLLQAPALQAPAAAQAERPFALMVGDPAPAIQMSEWVQGKPIERFEPGQSYVVEFWATWCGPCKVAIPHLNELSKQYAGKVQFVGVSVWERLKGGGAYLVPGFVKEMGDKMTYTVGSDQVKESDPARMAKDWMEAAGQSGIPTAFIVNGQGRIAWIGHPMTIDKPLAEVAAGTFDLDAAAKKYALDIKVKGVSQKLQREIAKAKKDKDFAQALTVIEAAFAKEPALEVSFGLDKYFLLVDAERKAEAATYGQRLVSELYAENRQALNALAWTLVDPQGKYGTADYALAVRAAERAVKLSEEKDASILDTLGMALFKAGDVERAIQVQTKALELAKGNAELEAEVRTRLESFKGANKSL